MAKKSLDWLEFLRITLGVFLTGLGVILVGNSKGNWTQLIGGTVCAAIGLALLLFK